MGPLMQSSQLHGGGVVNAPILPKHRDVKSLIWPPKFKGAEPGLGTRLSASESELSRGTCTTIQPCNKEKEE